MLSVRYAECHYAEWHMLGVVTLNVLILIVVKLNFVMLIAECLGVLKYSIYIDTRNLREGLKLSEYSQARKIQLISIQLMFCYIANK